MSNITFNEQGYVINNEFDETGRISSETGRFELSEEIGGIVFGGSSVITRGVNVTEFLSIFVNGNSDIKINKVFPNRIISQGGIVFNGNSEIIHSGNEIITTIGGGAVPIIKKKNLLVEF